MFKRAKLLTKWRWNAAIVVRRCASSSLKKWCHCQRRSCLTSKVILVFRWHRLNFAGAMKKTQVLKKFSDTAWCILAIFSSVVELTVAKLAWLNLEEVTAHFVMLRKIFWCCFLNDIISQKLELLSSIPLEAFLTIAFEGKSFSSTKFEDKKETKNICVLLQTHKKMKVFSHFVDKPWQDIF